MKKLTTLLIFSLAIQSYAIDRFVDPNLSSGNGTTLFTNITSAVAAAVNGDRIIVSSNTYNETTLTISKSLKIIPQTAGASINFNANIIIAGFPGMELEILGFNLGVYNITSNNIGSFANRISVNLINIQAANVYFNIIYNKVNIISSVITDEVIIRFGKIINSSCKSLYVYDEPESNLLEDKILIVANTITKVLNYHNGSHIFIIANNVLKDLFVTKWNQNTQLVNKIINNNFESSRLHFATLQGNLSCCNYYQQYPVQFYNFIFSSNSITGTIAFSGFQNFTNISRYLTFDGVETRVRDIFLLTNPTSEWNNYLFSSTFSGFPNPNSQGFFNWSYNSISLPCNTPSGQQALNLTNSVNAGGNPGHDFYNIDLTINERGINGGPYSVLNYNPTSNPNNSKAFIFDLEMPTDLFPGQSVNIKADGYHKN